ncbi:rRNA-processing protein EFG1 [Rhodotorula toruloides]|uniref:rRNA-processing protein EFG1 n=1 Tax=Rhodotorula toruloides TaxID=5286 RepID=A0A511K745_RHOTO|nr:rRNA-processing protein EFG1 [Rhodotorula toruloides]
MSAAVVDAAVDEETCPICLELLSLRLAGEKPHVVPVCGHRLLYGDVRAAKARTSGSLGLCGVCRRDMKIGDGSEAPGKGNKFAKLSGLPAVGPSHSGAAGSLRGGRPDPLFDDDASRSEIKDDDLVQFPLPSSSIYMPFAPHSSYRESASTGTGSTVTSGSLARRGSGDNGVSSNVEIVKPVMTVRAEHTSVDRSYERDKKQHLTCMVSLHMPSRYPPPPQFANLDSQPLQEPSNGRALPLLPLHRPPSNPPGSIRSLPRSSSPSSSVYSAYAFGATGASSTAQHNPFAPVVDDLLKRMADWKGHSPEEFGQLRLYDTVNVRKDAATREFIVYLFEEAILCVLDDKRKGIAGKLVDAVTPGGEGDKLRLKGRVYIRHIRAVADSSKGDELSLTITMNDDAVAEFVMLFKERTSLEVWKAQIEILLRQVHASPTDSGYPETPASARMPDRRDVVSEVSSSDASRLTAFSGFSRTTSTSLGPSASVIHEVDESGTGDEFGQFAQSAAFGSSGFKSAVVYGQSSLGRSESVPTSRTMHGAARNFAPLDLMLILSVPAPGSGNLKTDILKNSLDFLINHVGPRTRVSVVTYTVGEGSRGVLRKTPFIAVGKADGKKRLEKVVEELGCEAEDLTSMVEHKEERVNVVTATNVALDVVLQRTAKSALTGMIIVNDGRDGAQKQQMDLVMARAEAANVPIHTIGYGKTHDPASLWLLSNHSNGSYTFVKDFYDLRDALAGIVGGILSIAATNVRLHIKVPETRLFRIRKVSGTPGAIVSRTGSDVDIEVGELRFGERKDLIVEVEMSLGGFGDQPNEQRRERPQVPEFSTSTDAFFLSKAGINPTALDEFSSAASLYDEEYDAMPDEAPLFEVNAAYRDPAAGKNVSRLNPTPVLLTITVNPPSSQPRSQQPPAAPEIVRRRMELLISDMLSRALLLMTRRNDAQAARLLEETKRIIAAVSSSPLVTSAAGQGGSIGRGQTRRGSLASQALVHRTLQALTEDVDTVHDACSNREVFEATGRHLAAQQAVVLRDQRAWTAKTATERLMWRADNSLWLVSKSRDWVSV